MRKSSWIVASVVAGVLALPALAGAQTFVPPEFPDGLAPIDVIETLMGAYKLQILGLLGWMFLLVLISAGYNAFLGMFGGKKKILGRS